jgi:hypothetical protein
VHTTQAAKPISGNAHPFEVGQLDLARIAHNHKLNITLAIDEHADLPASFVGKFANLTSKFRRHDLVWRNAALVEFLDPPQLVWLKTLCVAVKTFHSVNWRNYSMLSAFRVQPSGCHLGNAQAEA